ncbi:MULTISPECIES: TetR/AcrR family transcriptional regulator [unclassified Oceanobacter]|uniref:TetR/AcrR family transcriptional regulator n=1 Tax=unclassified Oceanobacter TaxID=2620260 RepID=UPI002736C238|nr:MULTISPECIES: TetR family transcriptional regulator [unclassified Oceanobacter]MDP2608151.1 TetR family transcriptional regulator [Oceanobacter sp. 1_MG-2023]MDP2611187.1 TetR family transcriptional regulator [Oceanobacter sp. 2_MG-2023]
MSRRGRPIDPEKQQRTRLALKNAARVLLENRSYHSLTIRDIATQADTQSAMVSYYFGGKDGLFRALIDDSSVMRQEQVDTLIATLPADPAAALHHLVSGLLELMCLEPWLIRLVQDDIFNQDSQLREHFMQHIPMKLGANLKQLLAQLQQQGLLRADLDIAWATTNLISLIIFPIVAEPVFSQTTGVDRQTLHSASWKDHISRLLLSGFATDATQLPASQPDSPSCSTTVSL